MIKHLRNERGQTLAAMGMTILALFGVVAIAVDYGHLAHSVNELQIASESAAAAGATALFNHISIDGQSAAESVAETDARSIVTKNNVDGSASDAADVSVASGNYADGIFNAGGTPSNAVYVGVSRELHHLLGIAIFHSTDSQFTRHSTATLAPLGSGIPNARDSGGEVVAGSLPVAISSANFSTPVDCTQLPVLNNAPDDVNTRWTSFAETAPADPNSLVTYLPTACNGGATAIASLGSGTSLNYISAANPSSNLLAAIQTCVDAGITTFKVPVSDGTSFVGFATLAVTAVQQPGGISGNVVCNAREPGPVGSNNFGTGFVALVK